MSNDKCLDYNVHMYKRTDGGLHRGHHDKSNDKTHNSNFGEKQMHILKLDEVGWLTTYSLCPQKRAMNCAN